MVGRPTQDAWSSTNDKYIELGFAEGAQITKVEFPDEDWWFGHHGGKSGLFPANYVQLET